MLVISYYRPYIMNLLGVMELSVCNLMYFSQLRVRIFLIFSLMLMISSSFLIILIHLKVLLPREISLGSRDLRDLLLACFFLLWRNLGDQILLVGVITSRIVSIFLQTLDLVHEVSV